MDSEASRPPAVGLTAPPVSDLEAVGELEPVTLSSWDGGAPRLATEVRLARHGRHLVVAFRGDFNRLNVDTRLPRDRPAPRLWHHDVVELFYSDAPTGSPYLEFEASPIGQWLALSFDAPRRPSAAPWVPEAEVSTRVGAREFEILVALPIAALRTGDRRAAPRLGLYRIHGEEPAREHYAHLPTRTEAPDFHRPERWAPLHLPD